MSKENVLFTILFELLFIITLAHFMGMTHGHFARLLSDNCLDNSYKEIIRIS